MVKNSVLELIGNTPMVKLSNFNKTSNVNVRAKLEYFNPSGSTKDRIAKRMIQDAVTQGALVPGSTIIESSTGNTGIALSFLGAVLGWPVIIFETTPGQVGVEKRKIMRYFGAEVRSLPPAMPDAGEDFGVMGAEAEYPGRKLCFDLELGDPRYWWAKQFINPGNTSAHHETGEEILEQCHGRVDVFVASVGTGGTLKGVAEVLRRHNPKVRIVGVQPAASRRRIVPGEAYARSAYDGGIIADLFETRGLVNEVIPVGDKEAVAMAHALRRQGFFAGVSSGANTVVALAEASRLEGGNVVTVFPDRADRYYTEEHYVT